MVRKLILTGLMAFLLTAGPSCRKKEEPEKPAAPQKDKVKLMTLDPGHFHAALVQKTRYEQVWPIVSVYAPKGPDVQDHLKRIEGFNSRGQNPTSWVENVYTGDDFLQKMLQEKPGNVVVISGNNRKKAEYIKACVDAGLNVLADKPMCINSEGFELLKAAFDSAKKNKVLLYDIMTERSEITTILQKELAHNKQLFGELQKGTENDPAVVSESVHHFFKYVAGNPIKRPAWYFDTNQQGEGIVDVTTHLVDLVMWECFPAEPIDYQKDVQVIKAQRWPTFISRPEFQIVTRLDGFPSFLKQNLDNREMLACYANGEITFTVKGIHAKVSVNWNFKAPKGAKDTHYSALKGSKANVYIRQGKEQNYRAELYIETAAGGNSNELAAALKKAIEGLQTKYQGITLKQEDDIWHVLIPDKYRLGHEAHFREVAERYLKYLQQRKLPDWELSNMKAKYYITTRALQLAKQ